MPFCSTGRSPLAGSTCRLTLGNSISQSRGGACGKEDSRSSCLQKRWKLSWGWDKGILQLDATSTPLQPRSRETAQPHSWSKKPGYATAQELEEASTHYGKILCISINNSLSHRLADPGFGALFPYKSNGVCTPELCVAWRKLVQTSAFFFFFSSKSGQMLGRVHNHTIFRSFKSWFSWA